jgi:RNA polymerase sigma factor (sigma-70 family)
MSPQEPFTDLLRRVRSGDEEAAAVLVRLYEPGLHRLVEFRLRGRGLCRTLDPTDVCQLIFAALFTRLRRGHYELPTAEDLRRLLMVMARNRLVSELRRWRARVRHLPEEVNGGALERLVCPYPTPSQQTEARELAEILRRRLSREERWLAEQRFLDRPWIEIAGECGASPEALRKRLRRACARLAVEFQRRVQDRQQDESSRR